MRLTKALATCFLLLASPAAGYIPQTGSEISFISSSPSFSTRNTSPRSHHSTPSMQREMVGMIFDEEEHFGASTSFPPMQPTPASLSSAEIYLLIKLERWYNRALSLKCPWMRRRMLDFVDTFEAVARVTLIRQQNLAIVGPPMGCRPDETTRVKRTGLSLQELSEVIRHDWKESTSKGYYITGKLNPAIYRDDCLFDGPDPDMPVKGLRKFRGAAAQLFDRKQSNAELLDLRVDGEVIKAKWRMNGVIRLPWKPKMPEVSGETTYHLDENNLIYLHEETWDISAVEAFFKTGWFSSTTSGNDHHHYHASVDEEHGESVPIS